MPLPLPEKGKDSSDGAPTDGQETSLADRLPRSRRGYDRTATDQLLEELASRQAELEQECATLREEAARLQAELDHHRRQEQLVSKTLLAAERHSMTIKEEARREAELTLSKARAELERRTARVESVERDRTDAEDELIRLRRLTQEMQRGLASFLTQTLDQLRSDAQTVSPELSQASRVEEALAGALEATLEQENLNTHLEGGEVASSRPSP